MPQPSLLLLLPNRTSSGDTSLALICSRVLSEWSASRRLPASRKDDRKGRRPKPTWTRVRRLTGWGVFWHHWAIASSSFPSITWAGYGRASGALSVGAAPPPDEAAVEAVLMLLLPVPLPLPLLLAAFNAACRKADGKGETRCCCGCGGCSCCCSARGAAAAVEAEATCWGSSRRVPTAGKAGTARRSSKRLIARRPVPVERGGHGTEGVRPKAKLKKPGVDIK